MISWIWIPITAIVTLLLFGLLKAGSDCDDWHDGFAAGAGWTEEADK